LEQARDNKNSAVLKLTRGVGAFLKNYDVDVFYGEGVVKPDRTVEIDGREKLNTKTVIVAGGSKAHKIRIPSVESKYVLTSDDLLELT